MGKTIRKSGILCFGAAASQSSVALVPMGSTLADSLLGREGSFKVKLLQLSTALGKGNCVDHGSPTCYESYMKELDKEFSAKK